MHAAQDSSASKDRDDDPDHPAAQEVVDRQTDQRQQQHEQEDEQDGLAFVRRDLFVHQSPRDRITE